MKNILIPFSIRFNEQLHKKLKVIAAYRERSLNTLINNIFEKTVNDWEKEHGEIKFPAE